MKAARAKAILRAFLELGIPVQATLNLAGSGTVGERGSLTSVQIQARIDLDRGEDATDVLDALAEERMEIS
jgi:hypothetical protein